MYITNSLYNVIGTGELRRWTGSTDLDGWGSDGAVSSARPHTQCACPTAKRNQKKKNKKEKDKKFVSHCTCSHTTTECMHCAALGHVYCTQTQLQM